MLILSELSRTTVIEGVVITIVGYAIVFIALVVLFFVFNYISKIINMQVKGKLRRQGKLNEKTEKSAEGLSSEVTAAIALALYLSKDVHDQESNVLTIKKVERPYSPWNEKYYGMRTWNR